MKKTYLLVSLLIASLFFVGCANKDWGDVVDTNVTGAVQQEVVNNDQEGKTKTTMENIFKQWKPTTCTFAITQEWQTFDGTLYVDGKNMRYTSKGTFAWQTMEMNVVVKDNYSYSWTNMAKQGYKMKETDPNTTDAGDVGPEERSQEMDFDCTRWVPGGTFDLPSDVTFEEMPAGVN